MGKKKYFIAITGANQTGKHEIYFVNDSDEKIMSLEMSSGGFVTYDDDPVTLSSFDKKFGEVEPFGYIHIDSLSPIYDLDSVNTYDLKVNTETKQEIYTFYIGPRIGFMGNWLPIINKWGRRIFLG